MNTIKNQVQLVGRAGHTPELKLFDNGGRLTRVRIATSEQYKNQRGESVENTQWHTVIAWGKLAEHITKHTLKGDLIAIKGKLIHRTYEYRQGLKRTVTEIVAQEFMHMATSRNAEVTEAA